MYFRGDSVILGFIERSFRHEPLPAIPSRRPSLRRPAGARRRAGRAIALWESGIRADRIVLERLRSGSSWRWGYGEGGALAEPAAPDDLPTALWADLIPNNRPTVILVR